MPKKKSFLSKKKPHYDLCKFKNLFSRYKTKIITRTARIGAADLGFMDQEEITDIIERLSSKNFYKSMCSDRFEGVWQDVYIFYDNEKEVEIYIKIQIVDNKAILIQFKECKKEET
jgi:hypothetical protein